MSRFFEALQRESAAPGERSAIVTRAVKLSLVPTVQPVPAGLARDAGLYSLAEQLSAIASVSADSRIFVAGCNPGDGASSVAVALALDLSQHLGLTTVLIDAHLQHPSLKNFFVRNDAIAVDGPRGACPLIRNTGLQRLELVLSSLGQTPERLIEDIEAALPRYRTAVFDLGVPRLDASLLRLIRPSGLALLVVRYGRTERRQLLSSVRAFSAANHPAVGVIFNAVRNEMPGWLRPIVRIGG